MAHFSFNSRPAHGSRNRPWSPPVHDTQRAQRRDFEDYFINPSYVHGGPAAGGQHWEEPLAAEHEQTLRRHRANLRAAYVPDYDDLGIHASARRQRREASDISVEALDLADYAQTLRRADIARNDAYPDFHASYARPFSREPWSPIASPSASPPVRTSVPHRTFSPPSLPYPPVASTPVDRPFSALSRDTMMPPPSLVSAGTTSHSSHTGSHSLNHAMRRPFSLPADYPRGPAIFNTQTPPPTARAVGTGRRAQPDTMDIDYGIANADVSSFPPWARKWYKQEEDAAFGAGGKGKGKGKGARSPVEEDIFGPYVHPNESQRDIGLLPWTATHPGDEPPPQGAIPDNVKEERMRMLEREFGDKGSRGWKQAHVEETIIGGIDEKGKLITAGPKKRAATRWLQAIFAVATAVSGIYGALFIKLKTPALPSGRAAAYILYVLSILTPILLFFFFVISPFCLHRNKGEPNDTMTTPNGMMVLPVNHGQTGKKKKKKGGKGEPDPGNVQVNLIVDPNMFGTGTGRSQRMPGRYDDDDYDEDSEDDSTVPSSRRRDRRRRRRDRDEWDSGDDRPVPPPRRSIFAGLAMERAWRRERAELKKRVALDIVLTILWTGCFVMILLGQRCPPGTLDGWCDAYNIATTGASFLIVLFGTSAFFDIKDLHQSKVSPRTRT